MTTEFALIERHFRRKPTRRGVLTGVGDDAAILRIPDNHDFVETVDTLVEGTHFEAGLDPELIGWKALAVSLSDLAAMGAEPMCFTMALTIPSADEEWLEGFTNGLFNLAERERVDLVGGDTTRGSLSVTVIAQGIVKRRKALKRSSARRGDRICVTGTLGDAALALRLRQRGDDVPESLAHRLDRPEPRVAEGRKLSGKGTAAIDISDGLAADLGHILKASGYGAIINANALPMSDELKERIGSEDKRLELALHGGEDYELCVTIPEDKLTDKLIEECGLTVIGEIRMKPGLYIRQDRKVRELQAVGYDHFAVPMGGPI